MVPEEALNKDFYLPDLPGVVDISRNWGGWAPQIPMIKWCCMLLPTFLRIFLWKACFTGGVLSFKKYPNVFWYGRLVGRVKVYLTYLYSGCTFHQKTLLAANGSQRFFLVHCKFLKRYKKIQNTNMELQNWCYVNVIFNWSCFFRFQP